MIYSGMESQHSDYIRDCEVCSQISRKPKREETICPLTTPYDRIEVDLDELPDQLKDGNSKYLLNAIDHFSRFSWSYSLTWKSCEEVTAKFGDPVGNLSYTTDS